ncbi:hypothetical protein CTAYLR_000222 [Chrysophaeum taylorii]|uniref:DUSP domain-containing protein n=1 Tax=Chrysophaeum taylorii TaxID=2483200 RepID=A0AAD7UGG1_9STRA|nr:hypothetical protein CTAYLR_000222 [Chrysophaeum taylorii]
MEDHEGVELDSFHSSDEEDEDSDEEARRLASEELAIIERRRELELALFRKYDSTKINPRRQCWFLVNSKWLETWGRWLSGEELPGAIDNRDLFLDPATNELKRNLRARDQYRAVNPMVWYIMVELYGHDGTPEICRYIVDAYSAPVEGQRLERACREPAHKARTLVNELRGRLHPLNLDDDDDDDEIVWCCCTSRRLDCLLFHLFTCCRHLGRHRYHYNQVQQAEEQGGDDDDDDDDDEPDGEPETNNGQHDATQNIANDDAVTNPVHVQRDSGDIQT